MLDRIRTEIANDAFCVCLLDHDDAPLLKDVLNILKTIS
jgi:hypothetical protein